MIRYGRLRHTLVKEWHLAFFNESSGTYGWGEQTAASLALQMGAVPQELVPSVIAKLVKDIMVTNKGHQVSGLSVVRGEGQLQSRRVMLETRSVNVDSTRRASSELCTCMRRSPPSPTGGSSSLCSSQYHVSSAARDVSDEDMSELVGRTDVGLTMASASTYPSFGYMLFSPYEPATTMWELWDTDTGDFRSHRSTQATLSGLDSYASPLSPSTGGSSMNSRNHIMWAGVDS